MDKRWIYAVRPTPNSWDVLHTDFLVDQQKLFLICDNTSTAIELQCNHGVMTSIPANANCARRIKASVTPIANDNSCRLKGGEMYNVRYVLQGDFNISLYHICYRRSNERSIYAHHLAYGFNLAASSYQRPQFLLSGIVSRQRADSFEARNVYEAFVRLLGPQQRYTNSSRDVILDRGHLVNSQDFLSYDQMDETFKYVNVMPQFSGINRSNWKRIENWIHNLPEKNKYAEVVTGNYGTLELQHSQSNNSIPMFLMSDHKNPISKWIYKVVKYNGECYVFITLNNPYSTTSNTNGGSILCQNTPCPTNIKLNSDVGSGLSYCCNYRNFVRKVGQHAALC